VFASDFLQIPLRNGHPCLSLTVPTTKPVTDFHRQDVTHAGRTKKKATKSLWCTLFVAFSPSLFHYL
ncbi:hypothetical protein RNS32_07700, partial [Staphylococcus pseudintermedius]|uniref:hypothetical protein n=1 Tax=Staphylococcus pseudintermedius TaxID=283734 RepID=UPI0028860677